MHQCCHGSIFIVAAHPSPTHRQLLYAHNSLTTFKQLTAFQSYQLTVVPPSDLGVLENVHSEAEL